jgi:hypothetical protein
MIAVRSRACERQQAALLDFVAHRERTRTTDAALDHLDRCERCTAEMSDVALAVAGLRRIGEQILVAEPAPDAWARLVARVSRPHPSPWRWRATLTGMVASTMLVAVLVAPFALHGTSQQEAVSVLPPVSAPMSPAERAYVAAARQLRLSADSASVDGVEADGGSVPRIYPDGIRPIEKEVTSTKPTGRPLSVI